MASQLSRTYLPGNLRADKPLHPISLGSHQPLNNDAQSLSASALSPPSTQGKGGGSQRSIDTAFHVNPVNGTASLSLVIPVTPGRGGLTPDLKLCHDSGSGNGPFGLGWQVPLENVTRKTSSAIPRYSAIDGDEDVFVMSNADELVPSEEKVLGDWTVRSYRPRTETQPGKIERWTSRIEAADVHWRAISGDNHTTVYGLDDDSRVFHGDGTGNKRIFSWLCCYVYDAWGNAMHYEYKGENGDAFPGSDAEKRSAGCSTTSKYIRKIRYGNRSPNRDLRSWTVLPPPKSTDWLFEVVFDYGEHDNENPQFSESSSWHLRRDCFSTYRSGFEIRTQRLCKRILMFHHMPEKLSEAHTLVFSTDITYQEAGTGSMLKKLILKGYSGPKGLTENLPPQTFAYHDAPALETARLQVMDIPGLRSGSEVSTSGQWIDLESEGAPGLLHVFPEGAWTYRKNAMGVLPCLDDSTLGSSEPLPAHPSLGLVPASYYLEDLDQNGSLDLVVLDRLGRPYGYQERRHGKWESFRPFTQRPSFKLDGILTRRMDVTGSGLSDVVSIDENTKEIVWYECLGKDGFGPERRTPCCENGPCLNNVDPKITITLADMSGDGLLDIVRIANGRVSYWSNLGYGRFSTEHVMSDSPVFSGQDEFNTERVMLIDIDGSGPSDLIYLPPHGGIHIYSNVCGNSWASRQFNPSFPAIDRLSTVFPLDLFGNGTMCLCWTGHDSHSTGASPLYYIDFTLGDKPRLLQKLENGQGNSTAISYRPSSWFYRTDEANGTPWKTKIPFPIHCVESVTVKDEIRQTSLKTRYSYHDGFYDGIESQFRGFGMVEQWDCETFSGLQGFERPPILTKSWFAVGDGVPSRRLPRAFRDNAVEWHDMPQCTCKAEEADIFRATKGTKLREEVFGVDGSEKERLPYSVTEYSYDIQQRQAFKDGQPGVYSIVAREHVAYAYDRGSENPRVQHNLVLQVSDLGLVLKSAAISYGASSSLLPGAVDRARQQQTFLTYTEMTYTNPVDTADGYRSPLPSGTRHYEVVRMFDWESLATLEELTRDDFLFFSSLPSLSLLQAQSTAPDLGFKVVTSETLALFKSQDLSDTLPHETLEEYSITGQSFQLALDKELLDAVYSNPDKLNESLLSRAGYIDLYHDGRLWQQSAKTQFGNGPDELVCARCSFFEPDIAIDSFGNRATTVSDEYNLLIIRAIDALRNTTETEHDYRTLSAIDTTDINGNHESFAYDALGRLISSAVSGKTGEVAGDSLVGLNFEVDRKRLGDFLRDPKDSYGKELLGKSSNRTIYVYNDPSVIDAPDVSFPSYQVSLSRTRHAHEDADRNSSDLLVHITYLDGSSKPLQTAQLYSMGLGNKTTWLFSGWETLDNKGAVVKSHQPAFRDSPEFNFECNVTSPAKICLRDPLGRTVAVLHPDHTWEKIVMTPWTRTVYDQGDLVALSDPRMDRDVGPLFDALDTKSFMPSWLDRQSNSETKSIWERDAAKKSRAYSNRPDTHYLNALGQTIVSVVDVGGRNLTKTLHYDVAGNLRSTFDPLQREVERTTYDYLGRAVKTMQMDSGESWSFLDSNGKSLIDGNSAGKMVEHVYDELERALQSRLIDLDGSKTLVKKVVYGENSHDGKSKNQRGRIVCVHDQSGVTTTGAFDFKGNCLSKAIQFAKDYKSVVDWSDDVSLENEIFTSSTEYDALSRSVEATDANGCKTRWEYNLSSELAALYSKKNKEQEWTANISKIGYSADGLPLKIDFGNGSCKRNRYDSNSRKVLQTQTLSRSLGALEDLTYYYDCRGNLTHQDNKAQEGIFFRNTKIDPSNDYTYDNLGRVVKASGREHIDVATGTGRSAPPHTSGSSTFRKTVLPTDAKSICTYQETYEYDDAGNIVRLRHEALNDPSVSGWTRTYDYEASSYFGRGQSSNKLTCTSVGSSKERYSYDGDAGKTGCMTSMPGYSLLSWDHGGRLRSSSTHLINEGVPETTWYVYNYLGQRVRKVTDAAASTVADVNKAKETFYLPTAELHRKHSRSQMRVQKETWTSEVTGNNGIVILLETITDDEWTTELTRYQMGEHLELDADSLVISYEEYSPFGSTTFCAVKGKTTAPCKYRWAAYERDQETGMMYCGARYYAPWLGRWISCDPSGTSDGQNLYRYVGNDPINYSDPTGLCGEKKRERSGPREKKGFIIKGTSLSKSRNTSPAPSRDSSTGVKQSAGRSPSVRTGRAYTPARKPPGMASQAPDFSVTGNRMVLQERGGTANRFGLRQPIKPITIQTNERTMSAQTDTAGSVGTGNVPANGQQEAMVPNLHQNPQPNDTSSSIASRQLRFSDFDSTINSASQRAPRVNDSDQSFARERSSVDSEAPSVTFPCSSDDSSLSNITSRSTSRLLASTELTSFLGPNTVQHGENMTYLEMPTEEIAHALPQNEQAQWRLERHFDLQLQRNREDPGQAEQEGPADLDRILAFRRWELDVSRILEKNKERLGF